MAFPYQMDNYNPQTMYYNPYLVSQGGYSPYMTPQPMGQGGYSYPAPVHSKIVTNLVTSNNHKWMPGTLVKWMPGTLVSSDLQQVLGARELSFIPPQEVMKTLKECGVNVEIFDGEAVNSRIEEELTTRQKEFEKSDLWIAANKNIAMMWTIAKCTGLVLSILCIAAFFALSAPISFLGAGLLYLFIQVAYSAARKDKEEGLLAHMSGYSLIDKACKDPSIKRERLEEAVEVVADQHDFCTNVNRLNMAQQQLWMRKQWQYGPNQAIDTAFVALAGLSAQAQTRRPLVIVGMQ